MIMNAKFVKVMAAVCAAAALTGCSDASAKLKDKNTALITIGNKTITKGDVFSSMEAMAGADTAVNDAMNTISAKEVEVTDEIKKQAKDTLKTYKSMYGDTFSTYLESTGMSEDDYMNEYLIPSLLAEQLNYKYVDEKWDDLVKMYKPVKATVLQFSSADDANAALSELKGGTADAATAAKSHNSTSDGSSKIYTNQSSDLDSMVRAALTSLTPDDGWTFATGSDGASFYALHTDDVDAENFRNDLTETFVNTQNVQNDAKTYYFKKYGFHIYDITIYNGVSEKYPDYLVQDMETESSPTPAVEESPAAESSK